MAMAMAADGWDGVKLRWLGAIAHIPPSPGRPPGSNVNSALKASPIWTGGSINGHRIHPSQFRTPTNSRLHEQNNILRRDDQRPFLRIRTAVDQPLCSREPTTRIRSPSPSPSTSPPKTNSWDGRRRRRKEPKKQKAQVKEASRNSESNVLTNR